MKPIELTEEHKKKLLEMCRVLYPEYKNFELEIEPQYDGNDGFIFYLDENNLHNDPIHWFEFCRYYIFVEINKRSKRSWKETSLEFMNCKHPITYLYEQFKKISNLYLNTGK